MLSHFKSLYKPLNLGFKRILVTITIIAVIVFVLSFSVTLGQQLYYANQLEESVVIPENKIASLTGDEKKLYDYRTSMKHMEVSLNKNM